MKKILLTLLTGSLLLTPGVLDAQAQQIRIKDVGNIVEARDNQLIGYGLVVGLRNTGDSANTGFTNIALTNLLKRVGLTSPKDFNSRNIASVIVTATLPPYLKKGQKIPVTVSSLGDATSLVGGTLLITPLQGADTKTYAVAQGPLLVGGYSEQSNTGSAYKNQPTVGRIPDGAIIEAEVPVTNSDQRNLTLVIRDPDFVTTTRVAKALQSNGFSTAKAVDANTIKIPLTDIDTSDIVGTIAKIENVTFTPNPSSKIIINSKTGTIVIGEMVRLSPVAITHGNISIKISNNQNAGGGGGFGGGGNTQEDVKVDEQEAKLVYLNPTSTLSSLVNALNEVGATPKDLASIIQALHESGALTGTIEIL